MAAGNVETSSRVADLVLGAFGRALGQGTMNNLTLGDDRFSYYETIGGGQGACADADGPSGVHVAMSNTLNTPIEALERDFPLRVRVRACAAGSGGDGRHRGGDGVVRELEALAPMSFSLIAERRRHRPRGAAGGAGGARGRDMLSTASRRLPAKCTGVLAPASDCASRRPVAAATERRRGAPDEPPNGCGPTQRACKLTSSVPAGGPPPTPVGRLFSCPLEHASRRPAPGEQDARREFGGAGRSREWGVRGSAWRG